MHTDMIRVITSTDCEQSPVHRELWDVVVDRAEVDTDDVRMITRVGRTWQLLVWVDYPNTTKVVKVPVIGDE